MKKILMMCVLMGSVALAQNSKKPEFVPLGDSDEAVVGAKASPSSKSGDEEITSSTPVPFTSKKGISVSGTVRVIREMQETEVFLKDVKERVIIPKGSKHNEIFAACNESMKKGTSVSLTVDPISRHAISVSDSGQAAPPAAEPAESKSAKSKKSKSHSSGSAGTQ